MPAAFAVSFDLAATVFSKTPVGLQEMQSRALGLPALSRRILVLVDGKRSGKELAAFAGDHDIHEVLDHLMASGCIDAQQRREATKPAVASAAPAAAVAQPLGQAELGRLPPAATRTPKDIEMARNFMANTTNSLFGQNMRLSLIKSISSCESAEELRQVYAAWAQNMASTAASAKRLPELRDKLLAVL